MDKNNDIQVNKISKWDAAPDSIKDLYFAISGMFDGLSSFIDPQEADNDESALNGLLAKVLDNYNELEAVHQKECGMISQYEEENKKLKSELDIKNDECDALISRVFKQDDEYTKLEAENEELRKKCKFTEDVLGKMTQEVTELEKEMFDLEHRLAQQKQETGVMLSQYEEENLSLREQANKLINARIKLTGDNDDLRRQCDRHIDLLDKLRWALEDKGIYCEWNEAALKWNLRDTANICESCKQHLEEELRIRCKEIDDKNKLIEELNQKIKDLESKNKSLDFKFHTIKTIGYGRHIIPLKEKIQTLEKENKDLKDLLEKDGEFGKNVGKRIADSIREGCNKGVYKLHPCTRIDIHVEETNSIPIDMPFGRYAIPRIAVMFNNTQTEMERDAAEHECEELNRKIKELEKEKIDLKTTLALCERDANMARELCHTVAFNAERARNKTPWFNDEPCNICTTKYALRGDDI